MTDTEAQEAALRESLAPLRAIAAQSQRMPDTEAAPHVHEWASRVQSDAEPAFAWDCAGPGCGETVTMGWRPEFSGLGFEDVGRIMIAENGGRLSPPPWARAAPPPAPEPPCEYDGEIEPGALKEPRSLAERVAALEELIAHPMMAIGAPAAEFTEEQEAELREALASLDGKPFELHVIPPRPLLTPELAGELLRECVTVVKPGEALVLRTENWTPNQVREYQDVLDRWHDGGGLPFKVVVVIADELGVVEDGAEAAR